MSEVNNRAATVAYPPINSDFWVVINRISLLADRVVESLGELDHTTEFALPFPDGTLPSKEVETTFDIQATDDAGELLYDDTLGGTTDPYDGDGIPYPPLMTPVTETEPVSLEEDPELFSLDEVRDSCITSVLRAFDFYTWGYLIVGDEEEANFQEQGGIVGLGGSRHPFFVGPIVGNWAHTSISYADAEYNGTGDLGTQANPSDGFEGTGYDVDNPTVSDKDRRVIDGERVIGHLLLVAPVIDSVEWYYQVPHGYDEGSGFTGPINDIDLATRTGELQALFNTSAVSGDADYWDLYGNRYEAEQLPPMQDYPITTRRALDNAASAVDQEIASKINHFWVRSRAVGNIDVQSPLEVPWIMVLGRSTSLASSQGAFSQEAFEVPQYNYNTASTSGDSR